MSTVYSRNLLKLIVDKRVLLKNGNANQVVGPVVQIDCHCMREKAQHLQALPVGADYALWLLAVKHLLKKEGVNYQRSCIPSRNAHAG